jgi:hypothetical protein
MIGSCSTARDYERARIGALLDAARESRSAALIVRGEAGVGESSLFHDARERADDTGELATVMRAADLLGIGSEALDAAERSKLVSVRGSTLDVSHPLIRSAI